MYTINIEALQGNYTLLVNSVKGEEALKMALDFLMDRGLIKSRNCNFSANALAPNMVHTIPTSAIDSLIQYEVAIIEKK